MIALLLRRNFRNAWLGGFFALTGDWLLFIALPISLYQLTGSALTTSALFVARLIPAIAIASLAGTLVDRWDRRRTLIVANLVEVAAVLPLFALNGADRVWIAFASAFVLSTMLRFVGPAEHALLPRLVDDAELPVANSLNTLNNNLARLIGPAVAGVAMAAGGLSAAVGLAAGSYAIAALAFLAVSVTARPVGAGAPEQRESRSVRSDWAEGFRFLARRAHARRLVSLGSIGSFGEGIMSVMFVVWVADILGGAARELGALMSAQAVGGIAGGVLLGLIVNRFTPLNLFAWGAIVFGALDLALFNYPRWFDGLWIGLVIIGLVGIPVAGFTTGLNTLLQVDVEDEYRGRVYGTMSMGGAILQLAGTGVAGVFGGLLGPLFLLNLQGGSYILVGVLALLMLERIQTRAPESSG